METFTTNNLQKITTIHTELELEQANSLFNTLRLLVKQDPALKPLRRHLGNLIEQYEA